MAISRLALRRFRLTMTPAFRTYTNLARTRFLKEIYADARKLDPYSAVYKNLERNGNCWYTYFQPGNSKCYGYHELQRRYSDDLAEIDSLRSSIKVPVSTIAKSLVPEYAHQSVKIEHNSLELGEAVVIRDALGSTVFSGNDLAALSVEELNRLKFPPPHDLLPSRHSAEVAELRNHIVASHWIAETAPKSPGTAGLTEDDLRGLAALLTKDTPSERLWSAPGWGPRTPVGSYRNLPISVKSNPMRVFPYPQEVPNLMKNFITWRNDAHAQKQLHPLILACQSIIYFFSIHPFQDGNGRVGRSLMQDYLIRQGYVPIVVQGLSREDYVRRVSDAQDGKPEAFVWLMLSTQLDMMRTFSRQEK